MRDTVIKLIENDSLPHRAPGRRGLTDRPCATGFLRSPLLVVSARVLVSALMLAAIRPDEVECSWRYVASPWGQATPQSRESMNRPVGGGDWLATAQLLMWPVGQNCGNSCGPEDAAQFDRVAR